MINVGVARRTFRIYPAKSGREARWRASLMPNFRLLELLLFYHLCLCGDNSQNWSYKECLGNGPSNWVKSYPTCGGRFQSPVDISCAQDNRNLNPLVLKGYGRRLNSAVLVNNGNTAQVSSCDSRASLSGGCLGRGKYDFAQFHFHWGSNDSVGSEHTIKGKRYPMEGHIVHINRKYRNMDEAVKHPDGIAVLAIFYKSTNFAANSMKPVIQAVKRASRKKIDGKSNVDGSLTLFSLLPRDRTAFYCYRKGSLTTPGCFEAATWTIFKNPVSLSKAQIAQFRKLRFRDGTPMVNNFRPQKPLNGRTIYFHSTC